MISFYIIVLCKTGTFSVHGSNYKVSVSKNRQKCFALSFGFSSFIDVLFFFSICGLFAFFYFGTFARRKKDEWLYCCISSFDALESTLRSNRFFCCCDNKPRSKNLQFLQRFLFSPAARCNFVRWNLVNLEAERRKKDETL